MNKNIKIGDRVKYSHEWLKSVGELTGDIPFARGVVESVEDFGDSFTLAVIDWGNDEIPPRVNVKNLVKVGDLESF